MKNNQHGIILPCVMLSSVLILSLIATMYTDLIDYLHTAQISLHASRRFKENQEDATFPELASPNFGTDKICLSSGSIPNNRYENCFILSTDYQFFDSSNELPTQEFECLSDKNQNTYNPEMGMQAEETCEQAEIELTQSLQLNNNLVAERILNPEIDRVLEVKGFLQVKELVIAESLTIISSGNILIENLVAVKPNLSLALISATGKIEITNNPQQIAITCYAKQSIILPNFQSCQNFGAKRNNVNFLLQSWQSYKKN